MRRTTLILGMILAPLFSPAQTQPMLQPWIQVYGTVAGQGLGANVTGIKPTANLPYRAAVSHGGMTSFYRLQNPTDTAAQLTIRGTGLHLGDLNGDGLTDAVVGKGAIYPSVVDTVLIYWGTLTGIDTVTPTKLTGSSVDEGFGSSICIGNIVGDATADLVIGASSYPTGAISQGRVYIYKGGAIFDTTPSLILNGDSTRMTLGVACAIGDLNNDGFNDLAVRGWYQWGVDSVRFDYVNVWFGGAVLDTTNHIQLRSKYITSTGLACFDANGDGVADLLWTHRDSGATIDVYKIFVHLGGANFSPTPSLKLLNPGVDNFGNIIVNAGDMNGDGHNDIAVGAYDANITSGFVFIFAGGPHIDGNFDAAVGMSSASDFGSSVASVGDVNGDGLADIIIGAPAYDFASGKGYWGIFLGDSAIHVTGVHDKPAMPGIFRLYQCYPNPFNPSTTIKYELNHSAQVILEITNMLGQQIAVLVNEHQPPGSYQTTFDGSKVASGTYFCKLTAQTNAGRIYTDTKKLTFVK